MLEFTLSGRTVLWYFENVVKKCMECKSMQKSILSVEINLHRKNLCSSFSLGFMHFAKLILLCLADFTENPTLQKASGNYCHHHVIFQSFQGTLKWEVKLHKGTEKKRIYILLKLLVLSLGFFIVTETQRRIY